MPRSRALRVLIVVALVVVLALVALVAVAAAVVRRPLPDHAGSADLPGLTAEVSVLRDARGVPTIEAATAEDLFRAQGYVHAQDRFFEMDYRRHVTAGRLSELVGENEDALAADKVIRTFGWRDVAEQELGLIDESTRRYLQAYAEGVNAYLDSRSAEELAVEYTVLGLQVDVAHPEPWDAVDSLAWLKAMAWDLRANYDDELARGLTYTTVRDVARVDELFPRYPADEHLSIVAAEADGSDVASTGNAVLPADLERALADAQAALDAIPTLVGEGDGVGSNSWVVSGDLTASGAPILANDPHLAISAPGVFMQMGLRCADVGPQCPFDVAGFTFAGFPGVIIGHNADLAWGLTNMGADVTDFFLERVDDETGTYLYDGERKALDVRTEVIEVNGGDPVELEVRATDHGPLVSDVLDIASLAGSPTPTGGRGGRTEVALAWTALTPGRTADAVFRLNTAAGAADVAAAAAAFAVPAQNIVWASTDGHIGYQAPGLIPIRQRVTDGPVPSDGSWPRPGWDSRYDWQGFVTPQDLPAVQDPPEGYVVAANQAVAGSGPFLTNDWDYGYRSQRIRTLLDEAIEAGTPIDVELTNQMQLDTWSPFADELVPALLGAPVADEFTEEAVDLLRDWDGRQTADSSAAAYFAAVWSTLLELTFQDDLPESVWPNGGSRWLQVVVNLLGDPDNPWWDDRTTVNVVESRDELLSRALETARLELTVQLGKDVRDWEWGRLHTAAPQHAVLGGGGIPAPVRELVNPQPLAVPGGSSIVNATAWDAASGSFAVTAGPAMRMVVDLGDLDASTWVTVTGTSGHPGSVHYTDQFDAWAHGDTFPWPFTPDAVRDAAGRELTLRPAS
ncbi:penicillin acylase family protein [Actinotalea fermentans]|uniref:Penicillin amidase n=1 Tax=Actinotalea fermentans TaxID=43671 RepID=A0A511YX18_9CELL|nr:penicillin acylase family protein [Actinotalea fermentans]KGM15003.1 penicillin amidase [Actinotalea fermentans ATCC 43279 = JCM 9966 = DSM 3133]GEN79753.1 penicillin amidase [Actinotalea fermentans]